MEAPRTRALPRRQPSFGVGETARAPYLQAAKQRGATVQHF